MAAYYTFEDLSGAAPSGPASDNPYEDVIAACGNSSTKIQSRYDTHRTNRNQQQKQKLLAADFPGVTVDGILAKLENPELEPGFQDPRHCLVFWARPTECVKALIKEVQDRLLEAAPQLWTMPQANLHMTALEITHSLTAPEIESLVEKLLPHAEDITNFTATHRARLVKPVVSFDAQALALSFLPADGEPGRSAQDDAYTYHHLRRDLFTKATAAGVVVASRYVIPSAHLTIGRFITTTDFETDGKVDGSKVEKLVQKIEDTNQWLRETYWPKDGDAQIKPGGEWIVGEEKGLDFRQGTLWYGGGKSIMLGRGF